MIKHDKTWYVKNLCACIHSIPSVEQDQHRSGALPRPAWFRFAPVKSAFAKSWRWYHAMAAYQPSANA